MSDLKPCPNPDCEGNVRSIGEVVVCELCWVRAPRKVWQRLLRFVDGEMDEKTREQLKQEWRDEFVGCLGKINVEE